EIQKNASNWKRFSPLTSKALPAQRAEQKRVQLNVFPPTVEDQILQCHIRNLPGPPSPLIKPFLREAGFWHVALVVRGCKLDLKLISALSIQSADWGTVCGDFLGVARETTYGGRIKMAWIRKHFTELVEHSTEVQRERYTRTYILQIIEVGGLSCWQHCPGRCVRRATRKNQYWWLSFTTTAWAQFRFPFLHPRANFLYTFSLATSHVGLPTEHRDIRLLLDQRSEAESPLVIPSVYGTQHSYAHSPFETQTPLGSLIYLGGSSSQPPINRPEDARLQPRMQGSQSTEGEKDEQLRPQPHLEVEPRRNLSHNHRPPRCGTDSNRHMH
ncbi:hypothetical protein Golob_024931, partial [Gossypium lobatum]|nr:hypothetical protein [Gossypium lobatum]